MNKQTKQHSFIQYFLYVSSNVYSSVSYNVSVICWTLCGRPLIKVRYYGESTSYQSYLFNIQGATPNHAFDNVWILPLKKRLFWTTIQYINLLLSNTPYSPRIRINTNKSLYNYTHFFCCLLYLCLNLQLYILMTQIVSVYD